ncbi:MAG: OmpA/MotB domain-containing protein [Candidatus Moranbacteria bacterium GW2011_GWE1_49_15]|nr:MAG: OmpA/MotB domain-containing protein [Candidatus Moranbacteria bacterium GW2011_GWE2_47_10]KKW05684.1 MAG: OmpA/MotB domain-containing protein [Candidatus Moranbacteria bacterium GW2011_GWE1_49_15]HBP01165.1 hypothetical protein [Candidatus Moranbacteria bacterium]
MKKLIALLVVIALSVPNLSLAGGWNTLRDTLTGAAIGAGVGYALKGNSKGVTRGAAAGAAVGLLSAAARPSQPKVVYVQQPANNYGYGGSEYGYAYEQRMEQLRRQEYYRQQQLARERAYNDATNDFYRGYR